MGVASILLSLLAGLLCVLGFLTAWIPVVGSVLSFTAPVVALVGITLGGMAWSRARDTRSGADLPVVAVIMNVLALIPALLVAFTCGVCNALVSNGPVRFEHHWGSGLGAFIDAGLLPAPGDFPEGPDAGVLPEPGVGLGQPHESPDQPDSASPARAPEPSTPSLPPPSLPAGPRTPLPPAPDALP